MPKWNPLPDLKDLIFNCKSIIHENVDKNTEVEDINVDRIRNEYKFNILPE